MQALGLVFQELAVEQIVALTQLRLSHRNLSVIDLSSFLLAKHLHATLLTGDSRLYELAISNDVAVHGILWLLDEMVRLRVLAHHQAAVALEKMVGTGARLPQDEVRKRMNDWSR